MLLQPSKADANDPKLATISVITPVLNRKLMIEDCVKNVADQGDVITEHIIVDGGSTDGTVEEIERLASVTPKIKVLYGPDSGQSEAMNKGIAAATGDAITFLNSDDFFSLGAMREASEILAGLDGPAFVTGNCKLIDGSGKLVLWNKPSRLRLERLLVGDSFYPVPYNPSSYLYSRIIHELIGPYVPDEHYAMDLIFVLSCAADTRIKMMYVDRHWGNMRLMPGTKTFDDQNAVARVAAIREQFIQHLRPTQRITVFAMSLYKRLLRRLDHLTFARLRTASID